MKLNQIFTVLLVPMALSVLTACSSGSASMAELCNIYAEIADNNQAMAEAYQAVYKADRDAQEALMQKATSLAEEVKTKNETLAADAEKAGAALAGKEIKCEASEAFGVTVDKAVFSTVEAGAQVANIVVEATPTAEPVGKPYVLFYDNEDNIVYRTLGMVTSEGKISVNFRVTINKGSEMAKTFGSVTRLMFVTESEYKGGAVAEAAPVEPQEPKETAEPEPAFEGVEEPEAPEAVESSDIRKGDNLVEALRKLKNISWGYNEDYGLSANTDEYWIVIEDADLTPKGLEVLNSIASDMADNINFSIDYIKPTAKVGQFEKTN